jgi:RNA polymerase sigma-70 factor (ECF subfamily)
MDGRVLARNDDWLLEELGWVRALAERLLADPNDADDVVQEAWLRTREAPVRFESRSRLRAWLAGIAKRMARDTLRARRRRAAREQRVALEARTDAENVVERSAQLEELLHAVRALDEPQRRCVLLRYMDGYSTEEIAAALSVSEEVVRKRLSRAMAHLRSAQLAVLARAPAGSIDRRTRRESALRYAFHVGALLLLVFGPQLLLHAPKTALGGSDGARSVANETHAQSQRTPEPEPSMATRSPDEASGPAAADAPSTTPVLKAPLLAPLNEN